MSQNPATPFLVRWVFNCQEPLGHGFGSREQRYATDAEASAAFRSVALLPRAWRSVEYFVQDGERLRLVERRARSFDAFRPWARRAKA